MKDETVVSLDDSIGKVFRHKRLFNYVVSPISLDNGQVKCHSGRNSYREFPIDYFKRDWKQDNAINYVDLMEKISTYPDQTPFTVVYDSEYEIDDNQKHSYIHFNDDMNEKINPFTMIMPVKDGMEEIIQKDMDVMNKIRKQNEFIQIDDFQGFEFGLIKYLEKKYLRDV